MSEITEDEVGNRKISLDQFVLNVESKRYEPSPEVYAVDKVEYERQRVELNRQFQVDLIQAHGLEKHPRRLAIYRKALELGGKQGQRGIAAKFAELKEKFA